ncbi:hypothetical protein BA894_23485 [Vibrio natriegens]|uniref:hypothetical protein n=1 Tax=Vibrio natriegens TaxID=691 RepID=UPI0008041D9F|nr:hypothetical protein [Vibrio natriegens]ANQ29345.1 hypothetical protein BA894_23485 [Vibrio natriegens]
MKLIIDSNGKLARSDNKEITTEDINVALSNGNKEILEKVTNIFTGIYDYNIIKPSWLVNDFNDEIWHLYFSNGNNPFERTICWNEVILSDGYKLTDRKHKDLLYIFKTWVTINDHPFYNKTPYHQLRHSVLWFNISKTLSSINGILIYGDTINICEDHFNNANEDFFLSLMIKFATHGGVRGFYNLYEQFENLFIKVSKTVTNDEAREFVKKYPHLEIGLEKHEKSLNITNEQRIKGCCWLVKKDCLSKSSNRGTSISMYRASKIILNTRVLDVYKGSFNLINELSLSKNNLNTEFESVYKDEDNDENESTITELHMKSAIKPFKMLGVIKNEKGEHVVEAKSLKNITSKNINKYVILKKIGRTKTIPHHVVLNTIQKTYDFCHNHQDLILNAILKSLESGVNGNNLKYSYNVQTMLFDVHTREALNKLGVERIKVPKRNFDAIRNNKGLFNLYDVLIGSVQFLVGAIMGRRQKELLQLKLSKNLYPNINPDSDKGLATNFYLIFNSKKTGIGGNQTRSEILKRPIPRSIALIIWKLEKFNENVLTRKYNTKRLILFNRLLHNSRTVSPQCSGTYNKSLDVASDYFETTTIIANQGETKRYYIRQHQLRRFFALVFFYSKSYDGLDTLRWMLCHTNIEMLYNYLTEEDKGGTLKGVKASYLVDALQKGKLENIDKLRSLISKRYNVNFSSIGLSTASDLIRYYDGDYKTIPSMEILKQSHNMETIILELLDNDIIKLEPEFFQIERNGDIINDFSLTLIIKE